MGNPLPCLTWSFMTPHGPPRLPDSRDLLLLVTTGRQFARLNSRRRDR
jgi:hypothetical protein